MGGLVNMLQKGAQSSILNPHNEGQGVLSVYVGKPCRFVARLVYTVACETIAPCAGVLYHGITLMHESIMYSSKNDSDKEQAWTCITQHAEKFAWDLGVVLAVLAIGAISYGFFARSAYLASIGHGEGAFYCKMASCIVPFFVSLANVSYAVHPNIINGD
jgi:hypothetical protein